MTFRWPTRALLTLLLLPACFSPNEEFCESNDDCGDTEICNLESQTCQRKSSPGADPDGGRLVPDTLFDDAAECGDTCIAAAPLGWTGPVARAVADGAEEPGACGDTLGEDLGIASAEILSAGSCDCSCGDATGLNCPTGHLREWTGSESSCELRQCFSSAGCFGSAQTVFTNTCAVISPVMRDFPILTASFGSLSGGSCGQATADGELTSGLGTQTRLCMLPSDDASCAGDSLCAPTLPTDFEEELCIVREGEHSCPELDGYTERTLLFTGVDDQRSCDSSSCSCSPPRGSCGGNMKLHNGGDDDSCGGALATLNASFGFFGNSNLCQAMPAGATTVSYEVNLEGRSCDSEGSAGVTGDVIGTGVKTLCCQG